MSSNDSQFDKIDTKILRTIAATRAEYHACTARHVASQMRLSGTAIANRLTKMRGELVEWNKVPGSVHLLAAGLDRIGATAPEPEVEVPEVEGDGQERVDVESVIAAASEAAVRAALATLGLTGGDAADQEAEGSRAPGTSDEESPGGTPDTDLETDPPTPSET